MKFNTTEEIIDDIRHGNMVVMMDDETRENEGDIIMAARKVTPAHINFMIRYARGLVCISLTKQHCAQIHLPLMMSDNQSRYAPNFTLSIEAAHGVTTGVSAYDRAHTILTATHPDAQPQDIVKPGHIFPIMARDNGVLERAGHTEASVDLARLAGHYPAGILCEVIKDDGTMARRDDLFAFAEHHGLKIGSIANLIDYRNRVTLAPLEIELEDA
jgi:3,4-dihydroxy 2-butanone 4-phosphate synthase / GTP cyclohydrolase II